MKSLYLLTVKEKNKKVCKGNKNDLCIISLYFFFKYLLVSTLIYVVVGNWC